MSLFDDAKVVMFGSAGASKPTGGINGASTNGRLYSVKPTDASGDFSTRRGSNLAATRVGPDGLIEKGRENLLLQSNAFTTTWSTSNSPNITSGQLGYDGSSDAWKIELTANFGQILQTSLSVPTISTLSIFVKAGTAGFVRLRIDADTNAIADFNLSDGSVAHTEGNIIATKADSLGNGWFRVQMTSTTASGTVVRIYPAVAANDLTGTSGFIYVQDSQLEAGFVATDVIATTSAAVQVGCLEDEARFDFTNGNPCRILQEPTRTNIVTHSEGITLAIKQGTGVVASAPTEVNPSGYIGGVVQASNLQGATGDRARVGLSGITDGDTVSGYFYIKGDSGKTINVTLKRNGNGDHRGTTITHTCDGEWQKVGPLENVTMDGGNDQVGMFLVNSSGSGSTLDSCLLWGYQIEKATYSTSYIPSYGVATERTGDTFVLGKSGATLQDGGFITSSAGTLFIDTPANGYGVGTHVHWDVKHVTNNHHRLRIYFQSTTSVAIRQTDTDEAQTALLTVTGLPANGQRKVAVAWNGTSVKVGVNGVYYDSTTTPAVSAMDSDIAADLQVLMRANNTGMQSDVNSVMLFNSQLTQAQLESLTAL